MRIICQPMVIHEEELEYLVSSYQVTYVKKILILSGKVVVGKERLLQTMKMNFHFDCCCSTNNSPKITMTTHFNGLLA